MTWRLWAMTLRLAEFVGVHFNSRAKAHCAMQRISDFGIEEEYPCVEEWLENWGICSDTADDTTSDEYSPGEQRTVRPTDAPAFLPYNFEVPERIREQLERSASIADRATLSVSVNGPSLQQGVKSLVHEEKAFANPPSGNQSTRVIIGAQPASKERELQQGWETIMKGLNVKDVAMQRSKWWWYLQAEKNRLTSSACNVPDVTRTSPRTVKKNQSHSRSDSVTAPQRRAGTTHRSSEDNNHVAEEDMNLRKQEIDQKEKVIFGNSENKWCQELADGKHQSYGCEFEGVSLGDLDSEFLPDISASLYSSSLCSPSSPCMVFPSSPYALEMSFGGEDEEEEKEGVVKGESKKTGFAGERQRPELIRQNCSSLVEERRRGTKGRPLIEYNDSDDEEEESDEDWIEDKEKETNKKKKKKKRKPERRRRKASKRGRRNKKLKKEGEGDCENEFHFPLLSLGEPVPGDETLASTTTPRQQQQQQFSLLSEEEEEASQQQQQMERKWPPRSRLRGLIDWVKKAGSSSSSSSSNP